MPQHIIVAVCDAATVTTAAPARLLHMTERLLPSLLCRVRLKFGIDQAEAIATNLQQKQTSIMTTQMETLRADETQFYEDIKMQAKLQDEARFYKIDRSKLTMKERKAGKERREQMLRSSIRPLSCLLEA